MARIMNRAIRWCAGRVMPVRQHRVQRCHQVHLPLFNFFPFFPIFFNLFYIVRINNDMAFLLNWSISLIYRFSWTWQCCVHVCLARFCKNPPKEPFTLFDSFNFKLEKSSWSIPAFCTNIRLPRPLAQPRPFAQPRPTSTFSFFCFFLNFFF